MIPTIELKNSDFETFTVVAKPNGLFLKESTWPMHVQFAKEFFLNCDERFVRFHMKPFFQIEIKLENATATYMLSDNPFRKIETPHDNEFYQYFDVIDGTLIEGKVNFPYG